MVDPETTYTGICYLRSQVKTANVTDGLSNTYLIGERNIDADNYFTGLDDGDDQSMYTGFNDDNHRSTYYDAAAGHRGRRCRMSPELSFRVPSGAQCRIVQHVAVRWIRSHNQLRHRSGDAPAAGESGRRIADRPKQTLSCCSQPTSTPAWRGAGELTHEGAIADASAASADQWIRQRR